LIKETGTNIINYYGTKSPNVSGRPYFLSVRRLAGKPTPVL
jgi:hypothetical protein